jgi:hypothetical protein
MSAKQLRLIILTLAIVLLLWGASERFSRGSDTVTGGLSLATPAQADVDTISLIKGKDSIVLAKQSATAWSVNGRRAAPNAVNELFQALHDSAPPELVAQDSSSFARLNVDSAAGRRLRIRGAGKPLLDVIIGARGSEYGSAYVRRPGDSHVYLWRGRLASLADRGVDEWRDKRIAAVEPDSVASVDVERGKDRYALQRAAKDWKLDGAAADSGAVSRLLEKYRTVTAAGFASPAQADSARAQRPARRLTVRSARGTLFALVFDSIPGAFWVHRTAGVAPGGEPGVVYRVNAWDVDGLTPASRSLVPAAPAKP